MPIYTYLCKTCGTEERKLIAGSQRTETLPCQCGALKDYQLPTVGYSEVLETKDKDRNKQVRKNLDKELKKRFNDHHDSVEIFEKIDKHGLDDAKKHGWLKRAKKV